MMEEESKMNARIKERIEQINSGIVPEGYQKTAFGIFPCDWLKVSLGEVSSKKGEYGLNAPACEYAEGLPKYLRITDIDEQGCYIDNNAYVNDTDSNKYILGKGDIVFARTGASVGKNYIYNEKDGILVYAGFLIKFSIKPQYNAYLICLNCRTKKYDNWVAKMCARSGQPGINAEEYATYSCIIPKSTQEQARIAEILMQWDKAIELQGKLVEAYQKLKKYCLNKMFPKKGSNVPEIRFPGFTAPWEQRKLNELVDYVPSALSAKDVDPKGCYDLFDANGIIGKTNKAVMQQEYITIIKDGAGVGRVRILPAQTTFIGTMGAMTKKHSDLRFVFALLSMTDLNKKYSGSTIPHIYFKDYGKELYCVPDMREQISIANCFSAFDNIITLHQKKREKLVAQRKILQQYLLTGIVRV